MSPTPSGSASGAPRGVSTVPQRGQDPTPEQLASEQSVRKSQSLSTASEQVSGEPSGAGVQSGRIGPPPSDPVPVPASRWPPPPPPPAEPPRDAQAQRTRETESRRRQDLAITT